MTYLDELSVGDLRKLESEHRFPIGLIEETIARKLSVDWSVPQSFLTQKERFLMWMENGEEYDILR